jgi:hypothetical protein
MFGYTLTLAGVTRIIEVCYFAPKYSRNLSPIQSGDSSSEHTLHELDPSSQAKEEKNAASIAFRHLPPFVCYIATLSVTVP